MNGGLVTLLVLAGGVGAVVRFVVDGALSPRLASTFPWATLLINVTGALALGVLTGLVAGRGVADGWRLVLGTGFCGGYTTFSTASVEAVRLARRGDVVAAVSQVVVTVGGTLAAAALGYTLAR